jgi:hypothetical protein
MEPVVICDIDGTIAECEHRRHLVTGTKKYFEEFYSLTMDDDPIWPVINVFNALQQAGYTGLMCTGRSDNWRDDTEEWLSKHDVRYSKLYMRRHGDYRDDVTVKYEMLCRMRNEGYQPSVAIDDRNKVVAMWRREGIVCLQAAEGDF